MPSNDNLTAGLGDLYRRQRKRPRPARLMKAPPRSRSGRSMALDPFYVLTVVLIACALVLQLFLMVWLEVV